MLQIGDEQGLESLRELFGQAQQQVDMVAEKLRNGEFISRDDLDEMVRRLVTIQETREKCDAVLEEEGLDPSQCHNLESLEKALEINRRRRELAERNRRIRETVDGFLSIVPVEEIHRQELETFQQELRDSGEEALIGMDQGGELALYRLFTDCVRSATPDPRQVDALKDHFGFQMVYAILAGQLQYVGVEEEPAPAPAAPAAVAEPAPQPEPEKQEEPAAGTSSETPEVAPDTSPVDSSGDVSEEPDVQPEPEPVEEPAPPEPEPEPGPPAMPVSSTFPLPDSGDLPYWEAWRDSSTGVTFQEFRDKVRNMPKARILLPAFTRLGVLDAELMVRFCAVMNWDIPWHNDANVNAFEANSMEEQVERSLWTMTKHGLVAEYRVPGQPRPLYCLTEYTNWCLRHEDIQHDAHALFHIHLRDGNEFCIDMGDNEVIARQMMDGERLLAIRERNANMADYLSFMSRVFEEGELNRDEMLAILNSFTIRNGRYMVLVPGDEKLYLCAVFHHLEEYRGTGGALLLTEERPEGPFSTKGPVFHCGNNTLSCWLGKWYTMVRLVEPQPEPEPEAEEDVWPTPEMEERVRREEEAEAMLTDEVIGPVEELAPENEMAQEDEEFEPEEETEVSEEVEDAEAENEDEDEEFLPEDEDVLPEDEDILPEDEDVLPDDEEVPPEDDGFLPDDEEVPSEDEEVPSEDEEVPPEEEDPASGDEESPEDGEPSGDGEALPEPEEEPDAPAEDGVIPAHGEALLSLSEEDVPAPAPEEPAKDEAPAPAPAPRRESVPLFQVDEDDAPQVQPKAPEGEEQP